jgi:hypothetical protein
MSMCSPPVYKNTRNHPNGPKIKTRLDEIEALVVKPKVAWKMLQCSNTRGYQLLATGQLQSFLDGRNRKILVASIWRYIERCLADEQSRRRLQLSGDNP